MDNDTENIPDFVAACIVLHNVCEMFGDECQREWISQPCTEELPLYQQLMKMMDLELLQKKLDKF